MGRFRTSAKRCLGLAHQRRCSRGGGCSENRFWNALTPNDVGLAHLSFLYLPKLLTQKSSPHLLPQVRRSTTESVDFFSRRLSRFTPSLSRLSWQYRRTDHSQCLASQHLRDTAPPRRPNSARGSYIRFFLDCSVRRDSCSLFRSPHEILFPPLRSRSTHGRTLQTARSRHYRTPSSNSALPPSHPRQQVSRPL